MKGSMHKVLKPQQTSKNHCGNLSKTLIILTFSSKSRSDHFARQPTPGSDPMIQNIILPQIGLAQEMDLKTLQHIAQHIASGPKQNNKKTTGFTVFFAFWTQKMIFAGALPIVWSQSYAFRFRLVAKLCFSIFDRIPWPSQSEVV